MSVPGSCLMIGLNSIALSKEEKNFIISHNIAGVILFKRNIKSFQQVHKLCSEIKSLTTPPPLIAIDMEGGEVDRFSHINRSVPWPSPQALRKLKPEQILSIARSMAKQLKLLGIDINFAPVVDLPLVDNPLLRTRIFGQSKDEILSHAEPFIKGIIKELVIPCLKHFPGHGGVSLDSHKTLPKDNRRLDELKSQLDIFQTLFKKHPCWIMTAHIEFPNIDRRPATFSKVFLKTLLRDRANFKGLVVSDDLDMSALRQWSPGERFLQALKGGCHLVITCQKRETPREVMNYFKKYPQREEEITKELINSSKKILKIRKTINKTLPDFEVVEKELLKFQPTKLLSSLGMT